MRISSGAWVDEFQPQTVNDCFLPSNTKEHLNKILSTGEVPTMLFCGPPGVGKTTVAKAICKELDLDNFFINASLYGNIDTIRTDVQAFASTLSFNGRRKIIILDEADGLTVAAQASLRGVINEFSDNASFILTANFRNKLTEPILSRMEEVDFTFAPRELPQLAMGLYTFILARFDAENVEYDKKALQGYLKDILSKSTDIRKILISVQKIAKTGTFNTDSLIKIDDARLEQLIPMLAKKDFTSIRTWVGENSDIEFGSIVRYIYDNIHQITTKNAPGIVMSINQHQYQHAFVIDKEINISSMLAEVSMAS